jgi:DNA-binding LytR/AlgR family response regulator
MLSPNEPDSGSAAICERSVNRFAISDSGCETRTDSDAGTSVLLKADGMLHRVELTEIRFIESKGDYLSVNTDRRTYFVHSTMKSMQESLPVNEFMRIHRSYTVRIDRIERIRSRSLHIDGSTLPVGVTYRSDVLKSLRETRLADTTKSRV